MGGRSEVIFIEFCLVGSIYSSWVFQEVVVEDFGGWAFLFILWL